MKKYSILLSLLLLSCRENTPNTDSVDANSVVMEEQINSSIDTTLLVKNFRSQLLPDKELSLDHYYNDVVLIKKITPTTLTVEKNGKEISFPVEAESMTYMDLDYSVGQYVVIRWKIIIDNGKITEVLENIGKFNRSSDLRRDQVLEIGKIYKDTVVFLENITDYDYFFFLVSKEKDTVGIIYYDDEIPFRKGDTIALQWKMDSIDIAGEGILSFQEWYVSGKKIGHKTKK
ncbi:hypothetical protein [uncultured Capnocytophaga sp.]|uniref:hypothetical protein n=1 Tax=uncultured Capnocytophaga sp. TaxID=159273 RepID=UPI0028EFCD97|nr:hypothetical protein [uncultured Capnocytophaga sp.]